MIHVISRYFSPKANLCNMKITFTNLNNSRSIWRSWENRRTTSLSAPFWRIFCASESTKLSDTLPIGTLQREEGSYKKDFERFREFCGFRHCIFSIKIDDFYLISSLTLWSVIKSAVHDGDNGGRSEIGEGFEVNNVECRSVVCCLKIKIKIAIQAPSFDNSLISDH